VTKRKKSSILLICLLSLTLMPNLILKTEVNSYPPYFFYISILCPNTNPARNEAANLMIGRLQELGIGIEIFDHTGWSQISPRTWGHSYPIPPYSDGGFDILFVGYGWGFDFDPTGLFHTQSIVPDGDNFYQYSNPEMDWAINNYTQTFELEDRVQWAEKIQEILYEDNPSLPIYSPLDVFSYDPNLVSSSWDPLLWYMDYQSMENWTIPGQTNFTYACPADFEDFHPYKTESVYDARWTNQIYCSLIERSSSISYNNSFAPYLAKNYTSVDGLTYNIHIKPDAKWADGHVLNASDVEYSFKLIIDPDLGSSDYSYLQEYLIDTSVSIISEFELEITFQKFIFTQENNLAIPLIPKHIWQSIDPLDHGSQAATWATDDILDSNLFGAGPYYLEDYNETLDFIHLKRNDYFDDWTGIVPYFEDLYFEFWSTKESALSALAAGDLDMIDTNFAPTIDEIPGGVNYELVPAPGIQEMAFNCLHPIIGTGELCPIPGLESAKHIRRAINYMTPRDTIIHYYLNDLGVPGVTAWSQSTIGFDDSLEYVKYNETKAREYMELAGYNYTIPAPTPTPTPTPTSPWTRPDITDPDNDKPLGLYIGLPLGIVSLVAIVVPVSIVTVRKKRRKGLQETEVVKTIKGKIEDLRKKLEKAIDPDEIVKLSEAIDKLTQTLKNIKNE